MKRQPDFDEFGGDAIRLPDRPANERVNLEWLHMGVRYRKGGSESDNEKMSRIKEDSVWPRIVRAAVVAEAETNINGKYKVQEINGGKYLVYAMYQTSFSLIEWLVPLEIKQPGEVTLDLYNKNAVDILNKDDD